MSRAIILFLYKTYDLSSLHMVFFEIGVGIFHLWFTKICWCITSLFGVVLDIKLREESKKEEGVGTDVVGKLPGEVTIVIENKLECMNHDAHKLHHLQCGQVLLPPEELLILRSHGRHHVIKVHDYVNERVEKAKE